MKTGGMRPNASFLYLESFTSSTNSTLQWYLSSGVRVRHENGWHAPKCLIFILSEFYFELAMKTGGMRPNASLLYSASFTSITNSTLQWHLSSGVTRVTYKNDGIKTKFNSSANPASDGLKYNLCVKIKLNSCVTELRYVDAV